MSDVALRAGVSVSTVSHVINGTRFVTDDKRQRVLDAVGDLGYSPRVAARSLSTSRTQTLGLAMSAISNVYTAELCSALERSAAEGRYSLLIHETHDDDDRELEMVKSLHQRRVDGIFLASAARRGRPSRTLDHLRAVGMPTVLIDRMVSDDFDAVGVENTAHVAMLTTHLADLGHRRIGLIAGREGITTTVERHIGYLQGLERAGLPSDPSLVVCGRSESERAERVTAALLSRADPPTALISANNAMTIGVLRALSRRRIRVPEQLALAAFDDFEWADVVQPRLTAVAQPIRQIGEQAVALMRRRLANPTLPTRHERLAPTFQHRDSCGCTTTAGPTPEPGARRGAGV